MLIDTLMDSYRELTGQVVAAQPVVTIPMVRPAANADSFAKTAMQARRHRRQRRLERNGTHGINGWTIRAW